MSSFLQKDSKKAANKNLLAESGVIRNRVTILKSLAYLFLGVIILNTQVSGEQPDEAFMGLRSQVLNLTTEEFGVTRENFPYDIWGLVMESGMDEGSYSLVCLADGTTSIYYSSGGGILGAGGHESVQTACKYLLSGANHFFRLASFSDNQTLPNKGETVFYFLGHEGARKYSAPTNELGNNKDSLSKLFHASHMVISKIRESQPNESGN